MNPSILVVDNFFDNPVGVREFALSQQFEDLVGPDGGVYTNTVQLRFPQAYRKMEWLFHRPVEMLLSVVRLNLQGELPHSWVHADTGYGEYAAVVYLNTPDQCQGGTAFWTHLETGADRLPTRCRGLLPMQIAGTADRSLVEDWTRAGKYTQSGFIGMRFNRAVFYRSEMFHSRWPWPAFGFGPQDGRLVLALFFNLKGNL